MNTYHTNSGLSLAGETLEDAIEQNFGTIAKHLHIGNDAGYQLDRVYAEYDSNIQAVVLHVTARGSDLLVNYDPAEDAPKTYDLVINASEDDCPVRIEANLKESDKPVYDPFDDDCLPDEGSAYGAMQGIIDEIGQNKCMIHAPDRITCMVNARHPRLVDRPRKFTETCRSYLMRYRPKSDEETKRMMDRVFELASRCESASGEALDTYLLYYVRTRKYFQTVGKMTVLEAIRNAKGMSQEQVAAAALMSVRQLRNYEECPGSTLWSASPRVAERLADALGVQKSEIVGMDGHVVLVDR